MPNHKLFPGTHHSRGTTTSATSQLGKEGQDVPPYIPPRDVPLAKNPSMGTAQQWIFLVLKVVLHAVVVISEVLRLNTKSRCSRCCRHISNPTHDPLFTSNAYNNATADNVHRRRPAYDLCHTLHVALFHGLTCTTPIRGSQER